MYGPEEDHGHETLTVVTPTRVIFVIKTRGWLTGGVTQPSALHWSDITEVNSVLGSSGMFGSPHQLLINTYTGSYTTGGTYKGSVNKAAFERVAETVKNQVARSRTGAAQSATGNTDLMQQLERLANLHKSGALTNEESSAAKRKLLS